MAIICWLLWHIGMRASIFELSMLRYTKTSIAYEISY